MKNFTKQDSSQCSLHGKIEIQINFQEKNL